MENEKLKEKVPSDYSLSSEEENKNNEEFQNLKSELEEKGNKLVEIKNNNKELNNQLEILRIQVTQSEQQLIMLSAIQEENKQLKNQNEQYVSEINILKNKISNNEISSNIIEQKITSPSSDMMLKSIPSNQSKEERPSTNLINTLNTPEKIIPINNNSERIIPSTMLSPEGKEIGPGLLPDEDEKLYSNQKEPQKINQIPMIIPKQIEKSRYRNCISNPKGLIYEDSALQIGLSRSIEKGKGILKVFINNKNISEELSIDLNMIPVPQSNLKAQLNLNQMVIPPRSQKNFSLDISMIGFFLNYTFCDLTAK